MDNKEVGPLRWVGRHWRRWGPYWLVALALLVASEALWRWQTWPVRDLLPTTGVAGSTV